MFCTGRQSFTHMFNWKSEEFDWLNQNYYYIHPKYLDILSTYYTFPKICLLFYYLLMFL